MQEIKINDGLPGDHEVDQHHNKGEVNGKQETQHLHDQDGSKELHDEQQVESAPVVEKREDTVKYPVDTVHAKEQEKQAKHHVFEQQVTVEQEGRKFIQYKGIERKIQEWDDRSGHC